MKTTMTMSIAIFVLMLSLATPGNASPTYTLNIALEVVQKYPGVDSPGSVIIGCKNGFPMDEIFTQNGRWEILGSKKQIVATGVVDRVSVKNVRKIAGPFSDENNEDYQDYIYNGTCTYASKIQVSKSTAYRFNFAGVDLKTSYSFSELAKKKWKLVIKTDLNCDGLYGKKCSFTSK